ncbi:MAG: hypothetical protein HY278_11840, partial [candidate division NC10 bacterium]|nr:hypothetical protein [candidate division NC10 bacterium]
MMEVNFDYSTRVTIGIILLMLFVLISDVRLLKETVSLDASSMGSDTITRYEKRFDGLKKILPPYGVVGYITDAEAEDATFNDYFLAQYALSPVIVVNSPDRELVVGNFRDAGTSPHGSTT